MSNVQIGYEYVNIDDCWATGRDPVTGEVIPDETAFPDGMKAIADYVHSKVSESLVQHLILLIF